MGTFLILILDPVISLFPTLQACVCGFSNSVYTSDVQDVHVTRMGMGIYQEWVCARRLEREDYCRELCTVYPYGLNDNVRKVGNVSSVVVI